MHEAEDQKVPLFSDSIDIEILVIIDNRITDSISCFKSIPILTDYFWSNNLYISKNVHIHE